MDLTFFPLTLDAIDQAAAESLCLFVSSDERPLTGLAGLVDWRLTARLSKLVRGGQLTGEAGEGGVPPPRPPGPVLQKVFFLVRPPGPRGEAPLNPPNGGARQVAA